MYRGNESVDLEGNLGDYCLGKRCRGVGFDWG